MDETLLSYHFSLYLDEEREIASKVIRNTIEKYNSIVVQL